MFSAIADAPGDSATCYGEQSECGVNFASMLGGVFTFGSVCVGGSVTVEALGGEESGVYGVVGFRITGDVVGRREGGVVCIFLSILMEDDVVDVCVTAHRAAAGDAKGGCGGDPGAD